MDAETTIKPWGCEVLWAKTGDYAGKLLYLKAGHKLSLQYHSEKEESFIVFTGRIKFHWYDKNDPTVLIIKVMTAGEHMDIPAGTKHRMEAIDNSCLFEVSTPELDDVVRLEDDYGRV